MESINISEEIKRCKENPIYFIENYMRYSNGNPVRLNKPQKSFIEWWNKHPNKEKILYFHKSWI